MLVSILISGHCFFKLNGLDFLGLFLVFFGGAGDGCSSVSFGCACLRSLVRLQSWFPFSFWWWTGKSKTGHRSRFLCVTCGFDFIKQMALLTVTSSFASRPIEPPPWGSLYPWAVCWRNTWTKVGLVISFILRLQPPPSLPDMISSAYRPIFGTYSHYMHTHYVRCSPFCRGDFFHHKKVPSKLPQSSSDDWFEKTKCMIGAS